VQRPGAERPTDADAFDVEVTDLSELADGSAFTNAT
jgi:hypothetical protein